MISTIKLVMQEMIDHPLDFLPNKIISLAPRRWIMGDSDRPIVQLELFDDGERALLHSIAARDGSGGLRTSFLTMLLLEDTIATLQKPYGVCSGEATISVYRYLDIGGMTAPEIGQAMLDFEAIADRVLSGYFGVMPTALEYQEQEAA